MGADIGIKRQHKAGFGLAAAMMNRAHAKAAVPIGQPGNAPFGNRKLGVPDQRAITENPKRLCHPLALSHVSVTIALDDAVPGFAVHAEVSTTGQTGVEMEALTAVTVAALTLFDMLKAIDKTMVIDGVRVTAKSGGRSGDWTQP